MKGGDSFTSTHTGFRNERRLSGERHTGQLGAVTRMTGLSDAPERLKVREEIVLVETGTN